MHKARLPRQVNLDDTAQTLASSPRGMGEADPAYFCYWSKEEALNFLKDLLESERIGVKAFAAIGRAADLHVADLIFSLNWPRERFASSSKRRLPREEEHAHLAKRRQPPCLARNAASSGQSHSHATIRQGWRT